MSGAVVMSGSRPTGRLHIGHYWGALRNWVRLQESHPCFFCVADWHMLTTGYEDTSRLQEDVRRMVADWLTVGLDPERSVIFVQSRVPEHAELALLLSMITPISWLENNPTYKEQLQELAKTKLSRALEPGAGGAPAGEGGRVELRTHGFLGYPVLQAADILLYDAEIVPVGQDQLPHIELSREIARRFNSIYGKTLSEPQGLLAEAPKVPGIDGRKMSKSYGNGLELGETPETLKAKVFSMYTDPLKIRAKDPGHPLPCPENPPGCAVFALHRLYSPFHEAREGECRRGEIGCVACKAGLLQSMEGPFGEFRERRSRAGDAVIDRVLAEGAGKASAVAGRTLERVRKAMRLR
jgi:tryptophanyl-tRNA synthetase